VIDEAFTSKATGDHKFDENQTVQTGPSAELDQKMKRSLNVDDSNKDASDSEEAILLRFLAGGGADGDDPDDFVSADERARQAELRRQQRRQRLARLHQDLQDDRPAVHVDPVKQEDRASQPIFESAAPSVDNLLLNDGQRMSKDLDASHRNEEEDEDEYDMFSASTPVNKMKDVQSSKPSTTSTPATGGVGGHQEDFDDAEGYYKAAIGEVIELEADYKLRVAGVIGKGVFSTVLKCQVESASSKESGAVRNNELPGEVVALKCVRHNETMAKAALQEIQFLQLLSDAPSGIVKLIRPKKKQPPLYYRGHVVVVMAYCEYNLRTVLQKFGRGVGLSLTAVRSYFAQLLTALHHLQAKGILHADIKPDNILVSSDFDRVQIGDFGSAMLRSEQSSVPTPYLVSRFYRAPEIILGTAPLTHGIDMWSLVVTIAELFTGAVLFRGRSNNEMLQLFQQVLRVVFPNRIIRQHLRECEKFNLPTHFVQQGATLLFQQQTVDPVTKQTFSKHVHLQQLLDKTPSLSDVLYKAAGKNQGRVGQLADLIHRCLALDPAKRIDVRSALKHEFFKDGGGGAEDAKSKSNK
jgi:serine/threonine-protein kinase PRP4